MFVIPCFIRKNTSELRKKLEELGYYLHPSEKKLYEQYSNYVGPSLHTGRGFYATIPIGYDEELSFEINCETNEELFLAIAALRDDSDINQWFTDDKFAGSQRFAICKQDSWKEHFNHVTGDCGNYKDWHKATVEKLISHFKYENKTS